jgi:hypothetical protein
MEMESFAHTGYFMLPNTTGITGMHHHIQLCSTEMGSLEVFAWADLEP